MIETEILQKIQAASLEERIAIIEQPTHSSLSTEKLQRPVFGFMKNTGTIIGDIVSPIIPESDWEVAM